MSAAKICPVCGAEFELDARFCDKDGSALRMQNPAGDLVGSIIAERYHVLRKLGEGGMGAVYLAEHVKMGRKSAVKVMNPGMAHDPDAISRFNREAANASRISHPNVAAIYDFGETPDGVIYLAMEFVEGEPLTKVIERQGALPAARAASIIRQAADALGVAHEMGIVHRDLKPDNIMIARARDGSDLVKVVDFGIAKATQNEAQKVTKTGLVVGTPEFMSPEQLAGDPLDGRSDIYSLALVAFNMLTGVLPFPSETVQESMIMRLTDRPKTLAEMKGDTAWPTELQRVMDRALARDARERYQTASEFGRDLVRAVDGMPDTVAAAAGTVVLSAGAQTTAVPQTRVASPGERRAPAVPAAPAPRRRLPAVLGGVAAVLVIGGAGAAFALHGRAPAATDANAGAGSAPARTQAPATPASSTVQGAPATQLASSHEPPAAVEALRRRVDDTKAAHAAGSPPDAGARETGAGRRAATGAETATPPAPVRFDEARRARLDALSSSASTADQALAEGDRLLRQVTTGADSVGILYYESSAYIVKGDQDAACRILRGLLPRSQGTKWKPSIEPLVAACP